MSDLESRFRLAAEESTKLPERPPNHELLELYALYKQATEGDVSGEKPGMLDLIGRAKHEKWSQKKGMSADDAKSAYVECVERLKSEQGVGGSAG